MRRLALLSLLAVTSVLSPASAQVRASDEVRPSPNAVVGQTVGTTDVMVTYGRPSVRGRSVFGRDSTDLVPVGQIWRLGANEATTVTFSDTVRVAGQPLAAGTYGLFAIPGETAWTFVFNRTANQWGAYEYSDADDALRVSVVPEAFPHTQEALQFSFDAVSDTAADLVMTWDRVRVPVRIETAP